MNVERLHAWSVRPWAAFGSSGRTLGLSIITALLFIALTAQWLSPHDPYAIGTPFLPPSGDHLLGTNDIGQDIFSQLLHATRMSLAVGFVSALVSLLIGVTVGVVAGYYRGMVEQIMLSLTDTVILIPGLPFMIILAAYLTPGLWTTSMAIAIIGWCGTARVLHPRVMQLKGTYYVMAARSMGRSDAYIIFKHILPNSREVIAAKFILAVGAGMLAEASLSFIGLGDPLNLSWGGIINTAFTRGGLAMDLWWWYLAPGLMITITVLAFILVADTHNDVRKVRE